MGIKTRLSTTRVVVPVAFLVLALLACAGFVVAKRAVRDDERRLLHERAGEAAAVLSSSANSITAAFAR